MIVHVDNLAFQCFHLIIIAEEVWLPTHWQHVDDGTNMDFKKMCMISNRLIYHHTLHLHRRKYISTKHKLEYFSLDICVRMKIIIIKKQQVNISVVLDIDWTRQIC